MSDFKEYLRESAPSVHALGQPLGCQPVIVEKFIPVNINHIELFTFIVSVKKQNENVKNAL